MRCLWCQEKIVFKSGQGWVHESDGTHLRVRNDAHGVQRDDHYATADYGVRP